MKLERILKMDHTIEIADVGAAFIGEAAPYSPLLNSGLAHLNAFEADKRRHQTLREYYGESLSLYLECH